MRKKYNKKGFTLVELIVVIAIVAVLAAIAIPVTVGIVKKSRKTAMTADCKSCVAAVYRTLTENDANNVSNASVSSETNKIKSLAGVKGTVSDVEIDGNEKLLHLTYTDKDLAVTYCVSPNSGCIQGHTETYNFSDVQNVVITRSQAVASISAKLTEFYRNSGISMKQIDSIAASDPSSYAYRFYQQLTAEQKAVLDNYEWCIVNNLDHGLRVYFAKKEDTASENFTIYKCDPEAGQFQIKDGCKHDKNGKLDLSGSWKLEWKDSME